MGKAKAITVIDGYWRKAPGDQVSADNVVSCNTGLHNVVYVWCGNDHICLTPEQVPVVMSSLNDALPDGHPLKITWGDVDILSQSVHLEDLRLAAKLSALLRPR